MIWGDNDRPVLGPRIGLSFVDLVSGGFGAAFFLFLVFATLPMDLAGGRGGGSRFMELIVTWNDPELLVGLQVTFQPTGVVSAPRMLEPRDRAMWRIDPRSGALSARNGKKFFSDGWVAGVALPDQPPLWAHDCPNAPCPRSTILRLTDPCPGTYTFQVRAQGLSAPLAEEIEKSAEVTAKLVWPQRAVVSVQDADPVRLFRQMNQSTPTAQLLTFGGQNSITIFASTGAHLDHCEKPSAP
jgi:hypothetical protein